ncbi:uncharacterized protein LOC117218271 [Megalopta genalis]|uniref:uncharacterized protein LOC117218271 n=1 Tax=Megalopta genalis TaxID=115081 RepID=UPI003FCFCA40
MSYGACIYLRSSNINGQVQPRLLCAKSRVAPLKSMTLPRLELYGAQLLAKLYETILHSMHVEIDQTVFWTDSTITLYWINSSPHLLKTFVANRVSDIQTKTSINMWRHVPSEDNPVDYLSRGQLPAELMKNSTKWSIMAHAMGHLWPQFNLPSLDIVPETKSKTCLLTTTTLSFELLQRYSSIIKLQRIIAYFLRFKLNNQFKGSVSSDELNAANKTILHLVQRECFADEIQDLSQGRRVHRNSKLTTLDSFLDRDGIIRAGGRLKHANIPYSQQHPIILSRSHHITTLILRNEHVRNMHAGVRATLYSARQRYWPLDGRNQARRVIRQCIRRFRANPPKTEYMTGRARVNEDRHFNNIGVDYCDPFYIKEKKFRNKTRVKVYVAVFVCLAVKTVHMELVSDMTTEGFLAALRRFIARRGKRSSIHSDDGKNFVGANSELDEIHRLINSQEHNQKVNAYLSTEGIRCTLNTVPEVDFSSTPSNKLSIWHHLLKIKRDFWTRWNKEYLNELNIRHKWASGNHGIEKGTLIIIKEDNLSPMQWSLGRVIEVHPGTDDIIRAVTIQTPQVNFSRLQLTLVYYTQHFNFTRLQLTLVYYSVSQSTQLQSTTVDSSPC